MATAIAALAVFVAGQPQSSAQTPAATPSSGTSLVQACKGRDGWSDEAPPARIFGDSWYVGTCGVSAVLITSPEGHILIDGGPGTAAPLIAANIQKLGFDLHDVRWIVSSHEHYDHVGGLAQLQRLTGAKIAALDTAVPVLLTGRTPPTDPQYGQLDDFEPITIDRVLRDGERVETGPLRLTVHATPAHTAGSASWTWASCEASVCHAMAYADSATVISAEGYRFTAHPDRIAEARTGLSRIAELPCDILATPHPGASNLFARLDGNAPLEDSQACHRYAQLGEKMFDERLARETGNAKP